MKVSIRHKLAALSFAMLFGVALGLTAFFSARELGRMRHELGAKGATYALLLSRQTEPSVAFDDQQTAREIMEATAQDSEVRSIALYASDGHVIGSVGDPLPPPDHDVSDVETTTTKSRITCAAPVVSREGPTGVLVLEMSLDGIAAARRRALLTSGLAGCLALSLGLLGAWLLGVALSSRLRRVQRATQAVAGGDLSAEPLTDNSSDEVGLLARDFNAMTTALREHVRTIEETARSEQQRLDALVTARTAELAQKNQDMSLLLDNAQQGFLTVDAEGKISRERSRILSVWFGEIAPEATLAAVLDQAEAGVGRAFCVALSALYDDMLPRELLLDQMPQHVNAGGRQLSLSYRVIPSAAAMKVLVMISDATDEIARRRAEAAQRDLSALCTRIVADESAVSEFVSEAEALRVRIAAAAAKGDAADATLMRNIHTLKGNAGLLGLSILADACHELESALQSAGVTDVTEAFRRVDTECRDIINRAHVLMGAKIAGVELTLEEAEALASAIASGAPRDEIARYVARLRLEPVQRRLRRFGEQCTALATRLGKNVTVCVEANEVRLDGARWAPFWGAFVHVLRNAVDHGVEMPEARVAKGKEPTGSLTIRALETDTHHVIEVCDDGAGIDFGALERKAQERGFAAKGIDALFCDGVSTCVEVTETSGRGVGMGAVRAACEDLGGTVSVESVIGSGTKMRFSVPMRAMSQGSLRPVRLNAASGGDNRARFA